MSTTELRALAFDVFGTVVDWRTTVGGMFERMNEDFASSLGGRRIDPYAIADEWRRGYHEGMQRVRDGEEPWLKVDEIHRRKLDELLREHGISHLHEAAGLDYEEWRDGLNHVWHRLAPWPDSVKGLERLKSGFVISTLSNGNVSLLVDMAENAGLPWDLVLSSELAGHFKPASETYLMVPRVLDLEPSQVMMVAAHVGDLRAAQSNGLRTAFVRRPTEWGDNPERREEEPDPGSVDVVADDFLDLAARLGV